MVNPIFFSVYTEKRSKGLSCRYVNVNVLTELKTVLAWQKVFKIAWMIKKMILECYLIGF